MELTVDRFVTTVISDSSEKALGTLHLIRSYHHNPGEKSWAANRQMTLPISRANTKILDIAKKRPQESSKWTRTIKYENIRDSKYGKSLERQRRPNGTLNPLR